MDLISRLVNAAILVMIAALAAFIVVNAGGSQSQLEHDIERWATVVLLIACGVTVICGLILASTDERWRQ